MKQTDKQTKKRSNKQINKQTNTSRHGKCINDYVQNYTMENSHSTSLFGGLVIAVEDFIY